MVLEGLGDVRSEQDLAYLCARYSPDAQSPGWSPERILRSGASLRQALEAVRYLGFDQSEILYEIPFDELAELVGEESWPIVFIRTGTTPDDRHAVVVTRIDAGRVVYADPSAESAGTICGQSDFVAAWTRSALLIARSS
jgi:ABC-type bacteriocin/lantibiotic exporter with double-glycine peptidase domain